MRNYVLPIVAVSCFRPRHPPWPMNRLRSRRNADIAWPSQLIHRRGRSPSGKCVSAGNYRSHSLSGTGCRPGQSIVPV
jgi:hypothetical protein